MSVLKKKKKAGRLNFDLRLCCGAFKTTPVAAIQVEMGEMPLRLRREQLVLVYWTNLRGHNSDLPSKKVLLPCQEKEKKQSSRH